MSFEWRSDDLVRLPADQDVGHWTTVEEDGAGAVFVVSGNVCAEIRFAQVPSWLPKFMKSLSDRHFPTLTVQDWLVVLGTSSATLLETLGLLLECGFVERPYRAYPGSRRAASALVDGGSYLALAERC